jgi:hypothetical protein
VIRAGLAALALALPAPAGACSLALALAVDVSSSVNVQEYAIQMGGIIAALGDPEIREAVDRVAPVWISVYEWSGQFQQAVAADWTRLAGAADMDALMAQLAGHQRRFDLYPTAIGRAVAFGLARFARVPATCRRRIIDISGDGENNDAEPASGWWAEADRLGVTINALVIKGAWPDPEAHYRDEVIHGPGHFMMVARNGFEDYPDLIKGKLLRELGPEALVGALPEAAVRR